MHNYDLEQVSNRDKRMVAKWKREQALKRADRTTDLRELAVTLAQASGREVKRNADGTVTIK